MKRLLPLMLTLACTAAVAESGSYRVELIVFRHAGTTATPAAIETLRSFAQFPAPLRPGPDPAAEAGDFRSDLPDGLSVVTRMGRTMNDAWRRLRNSPLHETLAFTAWEQNRTDYYPPMRIHDAELMDTRLQPPTPLMVAELTAPDPLAAYRNRFYRLDGTLQLHRSRFLHLYLDLEYRVDPPAPAEGDEGPMEAAAAEPGDRPETLAFTLRQNRQVRTGQVQYFDTPDLGALVLVTALR